MSNQIKTTENCDWFTSSYPKEKETLKETSQETKVNIKKVNFVI